MTELVYTNKDFSGHIPSADSFSRNGNSSHAASFPAVSQLFPGSMPASFVHQEVIQKTGDNSSGVAQFEKDEAILLTLILGALLSAPELLGFGTGMLAAFAFMAFLNWLKVNQKSNKEAVRKVTPLAKRLGYDPQQIVNHLNQAIGGFSPGEVNKFCHDYCNDWHYKQNWDLQEGELSPLGKRGLVPPRLIQNLTGDNQQKVDTIFSRLNNFGFTYIGNNVETIDGFMSRKGDCHTLSKMFKEAVGAAGINGVEIEFSGDPILVEPHQIHGRSAISNVEGDPAWFFTNHFWCTYNGQVYDLLFMMKALPQTHHYTQTKEHRQVKFMTFDNGWCMITDTEAEERMGMELGGKLGIMKTSSGAMRAYINANSENIIKRPQNELEW